MSLTKVSLSVVMAAGVLVVPVAIADTCSEVVADTVAEMRAGAGSVWNDAMESLARSAAGSACIKATSSRYAMSTGETINSEAVFVNGANGTDGTESTSTANPKSDDQDSEELVIKPLTSSPSKKPFERARLSSD